MKTKILLFFVLSTVTSEERKCYDCDPHVPGRCINPLEDNVPSTVCKEETLESGLKKQISNMDNRDSNATFECFSMYFVTPEYDYTPNGVYRGCVRKSRDVVPCDYLAEFLDVGEVVQCTTCSSNDCNVDYVGGAHDLTVSLGVIVNLLLCVKLFSL